MERYTPYGEPSDMQLDAGPGFTGHATDVATGLTYMQQRYMDAELGRFLTPDPVGPEEDFINHFNRYNYALNNPVRYTDPDGRAPHGCGVGGCNNERIETTIKNNEHLEFDGKKLSLIDTNGRVIKSWSAVSGRNGYQEAQYQNMTDKGPIPEGVYMVNQGQAQSIDAKSSILGVFGRGEWPGGESAWGSNRIWLDPANTTNTMGRDGFSIHGGSSPGSAGCIDLTKNMSDFVQALKENGGKGMLLRVRYEGVKNEK